MGWEGQERVGRRERERENEGGGGGEAAACDNALCARGDTGVRVIHPETLHQTLNNMASEIQRFVMRESECVFAWQCTERK